MYETFYGFREKPFSLFPDCRFLYINRRNKLALSLLEYGILNQNGMILLTGDPGTGKSTLLQNILMTKPTTTRVGVLAFTHQQTESLLPWILQAFELPSPGKVVADMYLALSEYLTHSFEKGKRLVLVVDEAQNLDADKLEELRLVFNLNERVGPVLQVLLAGHTQLREQLKDDQLQAFRQRIGTDFHLEPFDGLDTLTYIHHRLAVVGGSSALFPPHTCEMVHRLTGGNPRLINQLCDTSLVYGYAEGAQSVSPALLAEAAKDRSGAGLFNRIPDEELKNLRQEDPGLSPASPKNEGEAPIPAASPQHPVGGGQDPARCWETAQQLKGEGWYREAIQHFKFAAAHPTYQTSGWAQVGFCYVALKRHKEAVEAFHTALTNPDISPSDRAAVERAMGQISEEAPGSTKPQPDPTFTHAPKPRGRNPMNPARNVGEGPSSDPSTFPRQKNTSQKNPSWLSRIFRRIWSHSNPVA